MPVIPTLGKLKQKDHQEFKENLAYTVRPFLKKQERQRERKRARGRSHKPSSHLPHHLSRHRKNSWQLLSTYHVPGPVSGSIQGQDHAVPDQDAWVGLRAKEAALTS